MLFQIKQKQKKTAPFPEKDPHVHKQTPQNIEHSVGWQKEHIL